MNPNRTLLNKILFTCAGILTIVLSLIKYRVTSNIPGSTYAPLEFTILLILFGILFYLIMQSKKSHNQINILQLELQNQRMESEKKESQLLYKIMQVEEEGRRSELFNHQKQKTINRILAKIDTSNKENFKTSLISAVGRVIESVTIISYWKNKESIFISSKCFGVDNELEITNFKVNEGYCGQAVAEKKLLFLKDVPEEYVETSSGLGSNKPKYIYFAPIEIKNEIVGLLEIGTFKQIDLDNIWPDFNKKIEEIYQSII